MFFDFRRFRRKDRPQRTDAHPLEEPLREAVRFVSRLDRLFLKHRSGEGAILFPELTEESRRRLMSFVLGEPWAFQLRVLLADLKLILPRVQNDFYAWGMAEDGPPANDPILARLCASDGGKLMELGALVHWCEQNRHAAEMGP